MALAARNKMQESLQAVIGGRKPRKNHKPKEPVQLFAPPRPKAAPLAERMKNPIVSVDIQTGRVLVNRLREYWAEEE